MAKNLLNISCKFHVQAHKYRYEDISTQSSVSVLFYVNNTVIQNVNGELDSISEIRKVVANKMNDKYESTSTEHNFAGQVTSINGHHLA